MRIKNWEYLFGMGVALGLPFVASANLVLDGSFEDPIVPNPPGNYVTEFSPGATIGPWAVTGGSVDLIGTYWQASDLYQSVDMAGNSTGTISQTINLALGTYKLTFDESGNPDGLPVLKQLDVSLGGGTPQEFDYLTGANTEANMMWLKQTAYFTVAGGPTALVFQDVSVPGTTPYGAALDNVVLTAVPEPTTLIAGALLLLPFGASTLRILRNRQQA